MATIVIDNADKTTVELFRSVAQTQGIKISVIDDKEEKAKVGKTLLADPLAFNKALDSMPILEGYDDVEIFPRNDCPAREIDWSE